VVRAKAADKVRDKDAVKAKVAREQVAPAVKTAWCSISSKKS